MRTSIRRAGGSTGFSLLEVLVALTVLGLSLGLLMRIFSGGLGNLSAADHRARALAVAESALAAWAPDHLLAAGFDERGSDGLYAWHVSAQPYATDPTGDSDTDFMVFEVAAEVTWDEPAGVRSLSLRTLRVGTAGGR